ncbi:MAG TPA: hypothetical protein PLU25_17020 [Acidobacteriota bacterium]|nr:hypothetical protein [Acidobacteriota bacterium]
MKQIDLARFQKSRESRVEAGGHGFTIRRPTSLDVVRARSTGSVGIDFTLAYVVGWDQVNESDLLPGGDPEPVAFDADLFRAWVAERPDLWGPLSTAVMEAYQRHEEATEARGKA